MPSDAYNTAFDDNVDSMASKRRVLFFAEPATLAHVVRPVVLAGALDREDYEIAVATGKDFRHHVEAAGLPVVDLRCIGTRAYLAAVAAGRPVYPYPVLERYVEDDLRVIADFRPDVIVGDFRLSLAVSARKARIPYVAISNAYWSPYAQPKFEVPVHAATRILGFGAANFGFNLLRPLIFAQHSLPMHRLRRRHGMPSLGFDLRNVFTEADLTLFADVPEMVPTLPGASENRYRYIGPVTWSPPMPLPESLLDVSDPRPLVYIALGSSGDESVLNTIADATASLGCRIAIASTDDRLRALRRNGALVESCLPGNEVAALAQLVICNGGSPAVHQALQQGTPVIGIPTNLDQMLNMHYIERWGSGLALRADKVSEANVHARVREILSVPAYTSRARDARDRMKARRKDFAEILNAEWKHVHAPD